MNIDNLLKEATKRGASDLHLTVGVPPVIRINGSLEQMDQPVLSREDTVKYSQQMFNESGREKFEKTGESDFSYTLPEYGFFRVNIYRQRGSVGIAIRILNARIFTLEELGLPPAAAVMARRSRGLILVTGPTGSGKSTTMAAMADLINREKTLHIVMLEDPIENIHSHKKSIITQREIGNDSKSFPGALRAALRQDPDVIIIGEMRDLETISIAVTAAETGHLVIATLHTSDAAQSVERIIDSFPSNQQQQIRVQLANSLVGVISQRLLPRLDNDGRIVAAEVLLCNMAVRNLIRVGKIHQVPSLMEIGAREGMQTMDKHLKSLYEKGLISRDDCLTYASDGKSMLDYLSCTPG